MEFIEIHKVEKKMKAIESRSRIIFDQCMMELVGLPGLGSMWLDAKDSFAKHLETEDHKNMTVMEKKCERAGTIKLITGPMFSSKTSTLTAEIERFVLAGKRCVIIKSTIDTRYDHLRKSAKESIITHNGVEFDRVEVVCVPKLAEFANRATEFDAIGITEVQFYPDAVEFARKWASNGIDIVADALSGDYAQVPFEVVSRLMAEADYIIHRDAVCMNCQASHAPFTVRKCEGDRVQVGFSDKYMSVCRACRDTLIVDIKHNTVLEGS